jgi:hypothetical protein
MIWKKLAEELKSIPHLQLPGMAPLSLIHAEINAAVDQFELINLNLEVRNETGNIRPWYGRGLIDYLSDSRQLYEYLALKPEWIKRDSWGDVIVSETELAALMPETMNFVRSLVECPRVTRLLRIPPGAILPWHSHCQSKFIGQQEYRKMVLQIPLKTNNKVLYRVRPVGAAEQQSQDLVYRAGEIRIFNSWHEHQVQNDGDQERISLYIESPLTDSLFQKWVEEALKHHRDKEHGA